MVNQPPPIAPATGPANTLYAGVTGQTVQEILYRIYLPDSFKRGALTGGVALPNPELRLASGQVLKGRAACNDLHPQSGQLSLTTLSRSAYDTLRDKPSAPRTYPGRHTGVPNLLQHRLHHQLLVRQQLLRQPRTHRRAVQQRR